MRRNEFTSDLLYDSQYKKSNLTNVLRNGVLLLLHYVLRLLPLTILQDKNTVWLFLMLMKKNKFVKGI